MNGQPSSLFRALLFAALTALALPPAGAAAIKPFSSDGCSLFPDGTPSEKAKWCDCCFVHDIAYWQGGTAEERAKADDALRDCVQARTGDKKLAEAMRLGVRAGGAPVSVMWYRWGYGWSVGRGYKPLTDAEKAEAGTALAEYRKAQPGGYCGTAPAVPGKEGSAAGVGADKARPETWAKPVPAKHLKNFYRLDDKVYRSAQPDEAGFRELEALGIRHVLNLRDYHTDKTPKSSALKLHRVEMDAGKITQEQAAEALRVIRKADGPVLVHCWHGSDRTGTVAALYRVVFQGWTKAAAIEELKNGGYGYHAVYRNIPELIEKADVEALRRRAEAP